MSNLTDFRHRKKIKAVLDKAFKCSVNLSLELKTKKQPTQILLGGFIESK